MKGNIFLFLVPLFLLASALQALAAPTGPDILNVINSSRRADTPASELQALAGNVTELNIIGTSVTRFWQGYYGNVSGTIMLSDANNNSLYRWEVASPSGEIYASRNATINWSNVRCANSSQIQAEDIFLGANSTADADSVNRTFNSTSYRSFYTGYLNFTNGSCMSTSVNGSGTGSIFYEVLQMDSNGTEEKFIYTSIIDPDVEGFDLRIHDFQMLVGEPGATTETYPNGNPTTYYFWVELQ